MIGVLCVVVQAIMTGLIVHASHVLPDGGFLVALTLSALFGTIINLFAAAENTK